MNATQASESYERLEKAGYFVTTSIELEAAAHNEACGLPVDSITLGVTLTDRGEGESPELFMHSIDQVNAFLIDDAAQKKAELQHSLDHDTWEKVGKVFIERAQTLLPEEYVTTHKERVEQSRLCEFVIRHECVLHGLPDLTGFSDFETWNVADFISYQAPSFRHAILWIGLWLATGYYPILDVCENDRYGKVFSITSAPTSR